jgi:hypothetical protein
MADQRRSPRVLTTALWADRQAGMDSSIFFRPLAVIDSSTRLPRPPPTARAKPSRCNGRRFRTSVVRSSPSQSLNSAIVQLSLAFKASKIDPCVGRIPCRRISASKSCVTARVTQRRLKHTQFSIADISSCLDILMCICTTELALSNGCLTGTGISRLRTPRALLDELFRILSPRSGPRPRTCPSSRAPQWTLPA